MAITLEEVEKLREKADLSYEEAKAALEENHGDLLEALIALERQGRIRGGRGGYYSTQPGAQAEPGPRPSAPPYPAPVCRGGGSRRERQPRGGFWDQLRSLLRAGLQALRPGNQFEVWRRGEMMTCVPVVILIVLIVVAFWISVPLIITGLFFGCRYRFSGPDLPEDTINSAMGAVSDTVDGVVDDFKREFNKHNKR